MKIFKFSIQASWLLIGSLSWASMGGVSGGGGCVIAPQAPNGRQDPAVTKHIIEEAIPHLQELIQTQKEKWQQTNDMQMRAIYSKLFTSRGHNLQSIVHQTRVRVEALHPCLTFNGEPVDGSINSKPGTVCVSAKLISEKVSYQDTPRQALALSLHELSEIAGLQEDEAVRFQTEVLNELQN